MKRKRSLLSLLLVLVLTVVIMLASCAPETVSTPTASPAPDNTAAPDETSDPEETPSDNPYNQLDLSKPYTVNMYVLGDTPADTPLVLDEINKTLEAEYNTTLDIKFIAWSDHSTKYSLILAGGEDVDIMFTAPWSYYYTEAAKGAFLEITDEFIANAMPQTKLTQAPESWQSAAINRKIYAVPKNHMSPEQKYVAIRDDLREKHNVEPLTDFTSLVNYLVTIAEKETPESGIWGLAASAGNAELSAVWKQQFEIMTVFEPYSYLYNNGTLPTAADFFLYWDSQYFRDFAKQMKDMSDKGVWSQDALTNSVSDDDAFANGQGACIAWNGTVFQYGKLAEDNLGATVGYYDITSEQVVMAENYNNALFAIAAASKNPERAGMVLDLLKNDTKLYRLFVGGIEGKHYINIDDQYHEKGPDADKYSWDQFAWGVRRTDLQPNDLDPRQVTLEDTFKERMALPPHNGFVFDELPVKNEVAAINAIRDEYLGMLELGMVDDVDVTIDEMVSRMNTSGLEIVKTEILKQYQTWLDTKK